MKIAALLVALVALLGAAPASAPARPATGAPAGRAGAAAQPGTTITVAYRVDAVTRLAKPGSDLAIGPGLLVVEIDLVNGTIIGDLRLPPAHGYFVFFGFVPSTARTDMTPVAKVTGTIEAGQIKAHALIDIRASEVVVDRQPLDVGPGCRTGAPAVLDVEGPFDLAATVLEGVYEIPAFDGCQGRERLDPLLTGLISGPGNAIRLTLTALPPDPATPPVP